MLHVPQWKSQLHVFAHYVVHFRYLSDTLVDHDPEFQFSMRIYLVVWQFWPCKSRVLPGWQRLPRTQTGPQIPQWLSKPLSIALGCFLCPFLMHPLAHTRKSKHKINFLSVAKSFCSFCTRAWDLGIFLLSMDVSEKMHSMKPLETSK